jgi:hypothetical protein
MIKELRASEKEKCLMINLSRTFTRAIRVGSVCESSLHSYFHVVKFEEFTTFEDVIQHDEWKEAKNESKR